MSRTLATGNILQYRVWCQDNEQASVNTFHYRVGVVVGIVTDVDAARAFDAVVNAAYKTIINNNAEYRGVECRVINVLPLPVSQNWTFNAGTGSGGAIALPRQTCGITGWRTAYAGPAHRGRTYWPFPGADSDAGDGRPSAGYVATVDNLAIDISVFASIDAGSDSAGVIFSLRTKTNPVPFTIASHTTPERWATQRRRGSYGRVNTSPI